MFAFFAAVKKIGISPILCPGRIGPPMWPTSEKPAENSENQRVNKLHQEYQRQSIDLLAFDNLLLNYAFYP
jgi:hypothetical protein